MSKVKVTKLGHKALGSRRPRVEAARSSGSVRLTATSGFHSTQHNAAHAMHELTPLTSLRNVDSFASLASLASIAR